MTTALKQQILPNFKHSSLVGSDCLVQVYILFCHYLKEPIRVDRVCNLNKNKQTKKLNISKRIYPTMNHTLTANRPQSLSSEHEIYDGLCMINKKPICYINVIILKPKSSCKNSNANTESWKVIVKHIPKNRAS